MKKIRLTVALSLILMLSACFNANTNQVNEPPQATKSAEPVENSQQISFFSINISPDQKTLFYTKDNNSYDNFLGITNVDESYWLININSHENKKLDFKLEKDYYLEKTIWLDKNTLILVFFNKNNTKVISYNLLKADSTEIFTRNSQIANTYHNNLYFTEGKKLKKYNLSEQKETELAEFEGDISWGQININPDETIISNEIGVFEEKERKFTVKLSPPPYYQSSVINLKNKSVKTELLKSGRNYSLFQQKSNSGFSEDGSKLGRFSQAGIEVIKPATGEILFKKEFHNAENGYVSVNAVWISNQKFAYAAEKKLIIYDLEKMEEIKRLDLPEEFANNLTLLFSGKKLLLNNKELFAIVNLTDYSFQKIETTLFKTDDSVYLNYLDSFNNTIISKFRSNDIYIIDENSLMKKLITLD